MAQDSISYEDAFGLKKPDAQTPAAGAAKKGGSMSYEEAFNLPAAKPEGGFASDLAKSLKVGVQRLPGMATGLADLPFALAAGARPFTKAADALGEATGFQPGKWADETKFSAGYEQGKKAVDEAWKDGSAGDIALSYLKNPGYTANQVAESLPSMVAGGAIGRAAAGLGSVANVAAKAGAVGPAAPGVLARAVGQKWAAPVAGGLGEGAVTAGQQMDQYKGEEQQKNALASLGAGLGTGLIGVGAGRVANALGLETAETAIVNAGRKDAVHAADEVPLSAKRRILGGMVSEALLQELPQSAQEQMWQNWADGKPLMDGVARAATEGAIAGGVMGAGANVSDGGAGKRRTQSEQLDRQNAQAAAARDQALAQEAMQPPTMDTIAGESINPVDVGEATFENLVTPAPTPEPDPYTAWDQQAARPAESAQQREDLGNGFEWNPGTSPGASAAVDGIDFQRDVDTSGLGLAPQPSPSRQLGLRSGPDAGGLEAAAALAVDTGASPLGQALARQQQEVQFLGATGRDVVPRRNGAALGDESNVIDVQAREVPDPRGLPMGQRQLGMGGQEAATGGPAQQGAPLSLPAPTNLREGLERIRQQRAEAARMAPQNQQGAQTNGTQAQEAQQTSAGQPQARSAQARQQPAAFQPAVTGAGKASPAAEAARQAGAKAFADGVPREQVAAIPNVAHRAQQLRGYDEAARSIAAPTDNAPAAAPGSAASATAGVDGNGVAQAMRGLAQQFTQRHADSGLDTDRTFATVLNQFAHDVQQGKRTPESVQPMLARYQEMLGQGAPVAAAAAPGGKGQGATHKEAGQAAEPATPAVVAQSMQTAAHNEGVKPSNMRAWALGEVDKALLQAPSAEEHQAMAGNDPRRHVTFDVPGDGKFKVLNTPEHLQAFRKKVAQSPGFSSKGQKQAAPERNPGVQNGSSTKAAALNAMIEEGDFEAARDYAQAAGLSLDDAKPTGERKAQWAQFRKDGTVPAQADTKASGQQADAAPAPAPTSMAPAYAKQAQQEKEKPAAQAPSKFPPTQIKTGDKVMVNGELHTVTGPLKEGRKTIGVVADRDSDTDPIKGVQQVYLRGEDAIAAWNAANGKADAKTPAPKAAQPEFSTVKTVDGGSVTVRTADLNSDALRLRQYTKDGKPKAVPAIHRDNLDLTGEKKAASAKEIADNPLFHTITNRQGGAFAGRAAAQREINRLGLQDTHEVTEAGGGFVGRKKADAPAATGKQSTDFIPASDGGLDYGEITPEMGQAMRRQAGKIRLQQGVQNQDGTGWGLAHIEARHGDQIRKLGYSSVAEFVSESVRDFDQIWQAGKTIQLVVARTGKASRATFLQLEIQKEGDFYRVNSAFPVSESYLEGKERKEGWKPLWSRYPVPADASGASGFVGQSPNAGETAPMVSGQSGSASVAQDGQQGQQQSATELGANPAKQQTPPKLSRSASTQASYESRIDALFGGGKAATGTRVLDRSDVMGLLGHPDVPLMLNERHLLDGLTNHPEMTASVWKKVPSWLENPSAVYTDPKHPGRYTVIAPERIAGYPVVLAVEPNPTAAERGKQDPFQLLVTAFANTTGDLPAIGYLAASGRLLYVDTKTAPVAWPRAGEIPRTGGQASGAKRILTEKNLAGWRRANNPQRSFAGQQAATADQHTLTTAQERIASGEDAEAVRQDTGWHKGADGKWRFEISDADAKLKDRAQWATQRDALQAKSEAALQSKWAAEEARNAWLRQRGESPSRISSESKKNAEFKALAAALKKAEATLDKARQAQEMAGRDGAGMTVGSLLDHPALFAAYPGIADVRVELRDGLPANNASYTHEGRSIGLSAHSTDAQLLSTLLHEIQHGIQHIEGFATGGNPESMVAVDRTGDRKMLEDGAILKRMAPSYGSMKETVETFTRRFGREPALGAESAALSGESADSMQARAKEMVSRTQYEQYRRLAGEVEARNTQARKDMTDEQRRATPPSATADIADSDVIVTFNGKEMHNAPTPANAEAAQESAPVEPKTPATKIRAAIAKAYGKLLDKLEAKGLVTLTQTQEEAIDAAAKARAAVTGEAVEDVKRSLMESVKNSSNGAIEGFHDPVSGKTFLIADALTEESAPGTLMHEVGVHMAADSSSGMQRLIERAGDLRQKWQNNPFVQQANRRMEQAGETSNEEFLAYVVTQYENNRAKMPVTLVGLARDFIAAVRAWLHGKGWMNAESLSVADIAAIARSNAKRLARDGAAVGTGNARMAKTGGQLDTSPEMNALRELAQQDEIFALPKSHSTNMLEIASKVEPEFQHVETVSGGYRTIYKFRTKEGQPFSISVRENKAGEMQPTGYYGFPDANDSPTFDVERGLAQRPGEDQNGASDGRGDVWIDVSQLKGTGDGAKVYAIAGDFAHNTGRVFVGDPAGLSDVGLKRRGEHMLSSALRWGTTRHLSPHPRQTQGSESAGVPPLAWQPGNDVQNLRNLVDANLQIAENNNHDLDFNFDPRTGDFTDSNGVPVDRGGIEALATDTRGKGVSSAARSGGRTNARHALLRALLRAEGSEGGGHNGRPAGLLENLSRRVREDGSRPDGERQLKALFSRAAADPYAAYTPAQRASAERVFGAPKQLTLRERFDALRANAGTRIKQGLFDQFAPIAEISQKAYMLARMSKGTDGAVEAAMLYGRPFLKDGVLDVNVNDPHGGFAKVLAGLQGEADRFLQWVAANRSERLKAEGKENLLTDADISNLKSLNSGQMPDGKSRVLVYGQALAQLNDFNEAALKVALESGLIDQQAFDIMQGQPYVPFYRLMEEGDLQGPRFSAGLVGQQAFKKLKGGTQQLNSDLLHNMLLNWGSLYAAAARNRAALESMKAADGMGIAYRVPASTKGAVQVRRDGVAEHWMVEDPYLMQAITALQYTPGGVVKALAPFKRLLTFGVTVNPAFKVRNLIRDTLSAMAQSDLGYNPLENLRAGFKATAQGSQTRASMLASGGIIRFGTAEDSGHARRMVQKVGGKVLDKQGFAALQGQMAALWDAYQEMGDKSENVNRAALYERLRAKGHSHAEASFMARDLMDFSMSGQWDTVRFLAQTVPFLNARLQGLYKLGRAAKENPKQFAAITGAVAAASLALLAAYGDDDDWKKREDWDRDAYWWFKVGETAFRIPKPFEVGAIGTLAERSAELMFSKEMTAGRFGERVSAMLFQTFAFDPIPQAIKPLMDVYANKDSFSGRAIEGMADERLRPQDRYNERTSEVARLLGQMGLPNPAELAKGKYAGLSPKQIDFLLRGYFGWMATVTTTATDMALRPAMGRGERPAMQLRDAFLVGNFVESLPTGSSRYVTQMYEQAKEVEQAWASYQHALKSGDVQEAQSIRERDGDKLGKRGMTNYAKQQFSRIAQQERRIEADKGLSADAKREQLQELAQRKHEMARRVATGGARENG